MANPALFSSQRGPIVPTTDAVNNAGGKAYALGSKAALAQYAVTGCFGATYYVGAEEQLTEVLTLAASCDVMFVAQCAIYSRQRGFMKDMPALLLAHLASRGTEGREALVWAWPEVIDNGKMLRNFVQIVRSGVTGRKSFGTAVKRLILGWLQARSPERLFRDNVGEKPSMADVIKLVHPKPDSEERKALYGYLLGIPEHKVTKNHGIRDWDKNALPQLVKDYEAFKECQKIVVDNELNRLQLTVPNVPFQMLDSLGLNTVQWSDIAEHAGWQMTRMNLNTFKRHGVLDNKELVKILADRLRDPVEVKNARAFPYQLMMAYTAATDIPHELTEALQDAMEIAVDNTPSFGCRVVVCPDVSGSMSSASVTGARKGSTSKVRCIDAAALIAAAILRKNPASGVIPFEQDVVSLRINPRDSILTIAQQIAAVGGGGTNCSAPLARMNATQLGADLVIYVSDNESWADGWYVRGTGMMNEWAKFKIRNPNAKLVCIDLAPNTTTQATSSADRLNVGGFSDVVFDVIAQFVRGGSADHWVKVIEEGL